MSDTDADRKLVMHLIGEDYVVLRSIARRVARDVYSKPDADEVLHHAVAQMLSAPSWDPEGGMSFKTWAGRRIEFSARNLRRTQLEETTRRMRWEAKQRRHAKTPRPGLPPADWDWAENIDDRVTRALRSLSNEVRRAAIARWIDEDSYEEIAKREGITVGCAKARCGVAIIKLRQILPRGMGSWCRPIHPPTRPKTDRRCEFPGCGKPRVHKTLCPGHKRQQRLGYELRPLRGTG